MSTKIITIILPVLVIFQIALTGQDVSIEKKIIAKPYYSGFREAYGTWNAVSSASDGRIYYNLSSNTAGVSGKLYAFNPATEEIEYLGDLTEICGETERNAVPQGKVHTNFYESQGKLYFATHAGYYKLSGGLERMAEDQTGGYSAYPGGHFLSYDLATGKFEDLQLVPGGEAIVTMTMDTTRRQIYALTWPHAYFLHYDVNNRKLINYGKFSGNGEAGVQGEDYQVICRSILIDPRDGNVYYSTSKGEIVRFNPADKSIKYLENVNLRLDYFGKWDPSRTGSMGYGWRRIVWYARENIAYGIHGSGYLFRFDPKMESIEIVERITSQQSKRFGMYDQFHYGYLGFKLGPDDETLYYLTGSPIIKDGRTVDGNEKTIAGGSDKSTGTWAGRGLENVNLVTYNIPKKEYTDHGSVFFEDGSIPLRKELVHYINAIAFDGKGRIYTCGQFEAEGNIIEDLLSFPDPLTNSKQ